MGRDPDDTGDYGYDLVHEEVARAAGGQAADPADEEGGAATVQRRADDSGDLSYDEAHGF